MPTKTSTRQTPEAVGSECEWYAVAKPIWLKQSATLFAAVCANDCTSVASKPWLDLWRCNNDTARERCCLYGDWAFAAKKNEMKKGLFYMGWEKCHAIAAATKHIEEEESLDGDYTAPNQTRYEYEREVNSSDKFLEIDEDELNECWNNTRGPFIR